MKLLQFKNALLAISICSGNFSLGQDTGEDTLIKYAPKVFIDCSFCSDEEILFFKQQISYLNFVRDRKLAQVQVLVTEQTNGGGGSSVTFTFIGLNEFAGMNDTIDFATSANNTEQEIRDKALRYFTLGMMRYVAKTPLGGLIAIGCTIEATNETVKDDWNNWVFEANIGGYFSGQESVKSMNLWSSVEARKITPDWKFETGLDGYYNKSEYLVEDTVIIGLTHSQNFEMLIVKSLGEHWSAGGFADARSSIYDNMKFSYKIVPAIECNLFPYSQSTRKQVRILYSAGFRQNNYFDTTIYNKSSETLFGESLQVAAAIKEPWGSLNFSVEGFHYFHDFSKNRLTFGASASLRLFKGLSLDFGGNLQLIHDQVSLPLEGASEEDILLRQRQLSTQYEYWSHVGLSYTFGSIYNSVVNPRFGD